MFDVCIISDNRERWEDQWSYVLSHWQPSKLYVLGHIDKDIKPFRETTIITTADDLPNKTLVVLSPSTAQYIKPTIDLPEFTHPTDCIYLFGSDHSHLSEDQFGSRVPDVIVNIPTDTHDQMYSWISGAVTLYDRARKLNG